MIMIMTIMRTVQHYRVLTKIRAGDKLLQRGAKQASLQAVSGYARVPGVINPPSPDPLMWYNVMTLYYSKLAPRRGGK